MPNEIGVLRQAVIFVDVDDTLIRSVGTKRIPITPVVKRVRELHAAGAFLVCWSSGGADYARESAEGLSLGDCFSLFLAKPDVLLNDQHPRDWSGVRWVHPNHVVGLSAEAMVRVGQ